MKLLLDTNVILDYFGVNEGFGDLAEEIINLSISGEAIELVSASAITDIYYVAFRRLHDREKALALIASLRNYVHILPVTDRDISAAIVKNWKDFEDAVQYAVAEANNVDFIITRNPKDYEQADIPVMTPQQFLDSYDS